MKELPVVAIGIVVIVCVTGSVSAVVVDSVVVDASTVRIGTIIDAKMIAIDPGHSTRHDRIAGMDVATCQVGAVNDVNVRAAAEAAQMSAAAYAADVRASAQATNVRAATKSTNVRAAAETSTAKTTMTSTATTAPRIGRADSYC
jgi:hypothetical protein